ncbi:DoxX family protein [Flavobacterium sp.]|uniref:DoxX family membrane protein n=1 Tax=Flavobacterium sp. TaxID=239 RepID=UPI00262C356F|nr:DoxX family protein [Flavobacterium sp.]
MRIAIIIVRLLLGGMMLFASISYFFDLGPAQPTPTGDLATLMAGFMASKYIFPVAKAIELIAGLTLISGKFLRIGVIILLPISINIFLIHAVVTKTEIPIAAAILLANLFLIYANWNSYKHLFEWK